MTEIENKALYVAAQCRKAGMTLAGAAGVLKNIEAEGAWDSGNLEDQFNRKHGISDAQYVREVDAGTRAFINDGWGFGLIQWTFWSRKRDLLQFARSRGVSIADFAMQVDFLIDEMQRDFPKVWNLCCTSNDAAKCCHDICRYYENPADAENESNRRASDVMKWYNFLLAVTQEDWHSVDLAKPGAGETQAAVNPVNQAGKVWLRTIDQGIEGWPEVWLLQAALIARGYNVLHDGIFGAALTEKVKQFQETAFPGDRTQWDGVCGPLTWAAVLNFR